MKKTILLLLILPLVAFTPLHKYYVTLTSIQFNKEQKAVQIIMNISIDDLELALNNLFNIDAQISNKNEVKNLNDYYYKYIQKHFKISINNQEKKYKFVGKEYDGDIVFFYLEVENISEVTSIGINNTILVKEFSDQKNLVKAKVNGKRKSMFLTKGNDKGLLNF